MREIKLNQEERRKIIIERISISVENGIRQVAVNKLADFLLEELYPTDLNKDK